MTTNKLTLNGLYEVVVYAALFVGVCNLPTLLSDKRDALSTLFATLIIFVPLLVAAGYACRVGWRLLGIMHEKLFN